MKIISRHLLREFLKILLLVVVVFIMIFFVVDFLERIDNFFEAGVSLPRVGYFFLMLLPSVVFHLMPVAVLVSILISMGLLARNSEVVAFKAGGISLYRLCRPIVIASAIIGILLFFLSDMVIPYTSARVNHIWDIEVERQGRESHLRNNIWLKAPGMIYHYRVYDERLQTLQGISVFYLNEDFGIKRRLEAETARRVNGHWEMYHGLLKEYLPNGRLQVNHFNRIIFQLPEMPKEFSQVDRATEEMSSRELAEWIKRIEAEGYDPLRYQVDFQLKFSFPFIAVIMALLGLPIAFWKEKGGGIALGIGVGIGLSFVYLVFLGLSRSLGYSGLLPPVISAWLPNAVFSLLGMYLFTHIRQ